MRVTDTTVCVRIEIKGEHEEITDFLAWCRQHEIHPVPGAGKTGRGEHIAYYNLLDAEKITEHWGDEDTSCTHTNKRFTGPVYYTCPSKQAWLCEDCGETGFEAVGEGIKILDPGEAMLKRPGMYRKEHIKEVIKDMGETNWLSRAIKSDNKHFMSWYCPEFPNIQITREELRESIKTLRAEYRREE